MSYRLRYRDIEGRDFLRMSADLLEEIYCNFVKNSAATCLSFNIIWCSFLLISAEVIRIWVWIISGYCCLAESRSFNYSL